MNNSSYWHDGIAEYHRLPSSVAILFAAVTSLFAIFAVGCNLVLMAVIIRTSHLHTKTNAMLMSVAFSEFLIGIFVMPFVAALWFDQNLILSKNACEFNAFVRSLTTSSKALGMLSVSVDRCLAVSHPLQYSSYITKTSTAASVIFVWSTSFVFALFPLIGVGKYAFIPFYHHCLVDFVNYETFAAVKEVTCSLLPAVATAVTLIVILFEARSHHRVITIAQLAIAMYSGPAALPNLNRYTRSTFKAMRTYIIITIIYLTTCFPTSIYVISVVGVHNRHSQTAFICLTFLTYICCVATPVVITTLSSKFKDSVKQLFVRENKIAPLDKDSFTISTGLHSILENSMVVQYVPNKDSVKWSRDNIRRSRDYSAPGLSGATPPRFSARKVSVLPEIQSASSSEHGASGGASVKNAHAPLRKSQSYPC